MLTREFIALTAEDRILAHPDDIAVVILDTMDVTAPTTAPDPAVIAPCRLEVKACPPAVPAGARCEVITPASMPTVAGSNAKASSDPVRAVGVLAPWIRHLHIKDAIHPAKPGEWGQEVPWGEGQVDAPAFLKALDEIGFNGYAAVEREAGDDRAGDIARAIERLRAAV